MAKSVDDLIGFLLEEIALGGSRGVSINELSSYVRSFYDGDHGFRNGSRLPAPAVSVDKVLLSKVWTWLGRHPDVSIGIGKEYNKKPLSEVESEYPGLLDQISTDFAPEAKVDDELPVSEHVSLAKASEKSNPSIQLSRSEKGPHVTVNEERIYRAICGHPPDSSKVAPLEFALLSHIAAARSAGILQGALGRASGQDKRSVPKRTDALQQKGYIVKETVYAHGTKTSRLILRKLATPSTDKGPFPLPTTSAQSQRQSTVRDVVRRVFEELSNQNIIAQTDLAQRLDMTSAAKAAVLTKVIRRLDRLRLVKRVKTAFGPSASSGDLKQCIQLVQMPGVGSLEGFDTDALTLDTSLAELISVLGIDDSLEPTLQDANNEDRGFSSSPPLAFAEWNPGRLMTNMLQNAVQLAGTKGLTNSDARKLTTGVFIRRTVEASLHRISCRSLMVQPSHLKHLAVVRTYVANDGIAQFFHYSWDTFRELAQGKVLDITQVPGAKQALKSFQSTPDGQGSSSTSVDTDSTGFPARKPPLLQMNRGETDFANILRAAGVVDIHPRSGEPIVVETEPGKFILAPRPSSARIIDRPSRLQAPPKRPYQSVSGEPPRKEVTLGRPRKYMRGTEKFWQRLFKQARLDAGGPSGARAARGGIMNDPAGLALYARRPSEFDETLLQAIDAHLPVPARAQDINEEWVHSTKDILDRSSDGVFITPKGLLSGSVRQQSQVLIFRSNKLKDVDFAEREKVYPFRFISSSASHSFAYRRFYPAFGGNKWQQELEQGEIRNPFHKGHQKTAKQRLGPQKGVFYEERPEAATQPQLSSLPDDLPKGFDEDLHETTDDEVQDGQVRQEIASTQSLRVSTTPVHGGEHGSRADTPSQQTLSPPKPFAVVTAPARLRPSRKRKLTEKAKRNARDPWPDVDDSLYPQLQSPVEQNLPSTESEEAHSAPEGPAPIVSVEPGEVLPLPTRLPATSSNHNKSHPLVSTAVSNTVVENQPTCMPSMIQSFPSSEAAQGSGVARREEPVVEVQSTKRPEINQTVALESSRPEAASPLTRRTAQQKRQRRRSSDREDTNSEGDFRSPKREGKQKYTAGSIRLCKKLVLHLMSETEGAAPNDSFTLRRIAAPGWKEAGFGEAPLLKTVKQSVKHLCQQGKLKQTTFSFRGKSGHMVQRSILYLPTLRSDSDVVQDVKRSVIEVEPADYIPPEWTDEGARMPLFAGLRRLSDIVGKNPRRRRASSTDSAVSSRARSTRRSRSPTRSSESPLPPSPPGAATGFVTLKVPTLGALHSVQLENWQSELARALELASAVSFAESRERSSRTRGLHSRDRAIKWANKKTQDFPASLQDIIMVTPAKQLYLGAKIDDRNSYRFAREIEAVEAWEQKRSSAAQNFRTSYAFIDHSIPAVLLLDAIEPSKVEFSKLIQFNENGAETEIPFPMTASWPLFVSALAEKDVEQTALIAEWSREALSPPLMASEDDDARQPGGNLKRKGADDDVDFRPQPKRRRGGKQATSTRRGKAATINPNTGLKYFARGVQYLRDLSAEQIHRLAVSVVVIRTLSGGLEGFIDWPLVMTLFPSEPEAVIRGRWKTLSVKYRRDIQGLTESLQGRYLDALEADQVPCVDFANLKATDWHGIVEWASDNLNKFNVDRIDELPADKTSFMEANDFNFIEPKCVHSLLTYGSNITSTVREETMSATVFGSTHPSSEAATKLSLNLQYRPRFEVEISDATLCLAKSWVFTSILTPNLGFDQGVVRAKLAGLAPTSAATDELIYRALKVLQDEKLIQKTANNQKSALSIGRGIWEPARKLYERFEERRMITAAMLRRAAMYKLDVLDPAFERYEVVSIQKEGIIDDGTMVAVVNLISNGLIRARPGADVPRTRYGLDWEHIGYKTREMDKSLLEFNVNLVQMEGYTFGDTNQVGRSVPVPRGDADEAMGHIPPWIDINGRFQSSLWEMFVAGVLGLVVQLPGVGAREISRALGFALDEGEVVLVMRWCVEAGFATMEPRSGGYETTRDWWLCISTGTWPWVSTGIWPGSDGE